MRLFRHSVLAVIASFFAALLLAPAAAQAPRVPPANDNIGGRQSVFVPFAASSIDVSEATIQTPDEQPHTCIGGTGEKSVWYALNVPAGVTLVVDTTGSNYDTVVSVWAQPGLALLPDIINVDCEDDGTAPALLKYPVTEAGSYLVSVSKVPGASPAELLSISFDFEIPASKVPKGSNVADAIPLKLNKTTTVKNMQFAIHHDPVVAVPACAPAANRYPVWFKLTTDYTVSISLSTEGSIFGRFNLTGVEDLAMDVFPAGFDDVTDDIVCDDNSGISTAAYIETLSVSPGDYYIRVLVVGQSTNFSGLSRVKLTPMLRNMSGLLVNGDFNSPTGGWTVKNSTDDGIVGNVFRFVGNPDENSQLKQTVKLPTPVAVNDDILARFSVQSSGSPHGQPYSVILTYTYTDGTTITETYKRTTSNQGFLSETQLLKKSLKSAKVVIKFKGTTGTFELDNAAIILLGLSARSTTGALPLPPAPEQK